MPARPSCTRKSTPRGWRAPTASNTSAKPPTRPTWAPAAKRSPARRGRRRAAKPRSAKPPPTSRRCSRSNASPPTPPTATGSSRPTPRARPAAAPARLTRSPPSRSAGDRRMPQRPASLRRRLPRPARLPRLRLVSAAEKNGGAVAGPGQLFGGGVLQAAAGGGAATFGSTASFGAGAQGAPPASQYVSRRGPDGWSTENITEPTVSGAYGEDPDGVPYQLFSGDLARALVLDGRRCAEGEECPRPFSLRESESGALAPLPEAAAGMRLIVASPDLRRLLFEGEGHDYEWSGGALVPVGPPPADPGVLGTSADGSVVYYQDASGLFLSREGAVTEIAPGAEAAQPSDYPAATGTARVSADGTRLVFLSREPLTGYDNADQGTGEPDTEVYLYEAGGGGTLRCASCNPTGERPAGPSSIPGAVANGTGEGAADLYKPRVLSADGRRLFFDSADRIAPTDVSAAPDVYEWEASGEGGCREAPRLLFLISGGRCHRSLDLHRRLRRRPRRLLSHRRLAARHRPRLGRPLRRPRRGRLPGPRSADPLRGRRLPGGPLPARGPGPRHPRRRGGGPTGALRETALPEGQARGDASRQEPVRRPAGRQAPWPSPPPQAPPSEGRPMTRGRVEPPSARPRSNEGEGGTRVRQRAALQPRALRQQPRPGSPRSAWGRSSPIALQRPQRQSPRPDRTGEGCAFPVAA